MPCRRVVHGRRHLAVQRGHRTERRRIAGVEDRLNPTDVVDAVPVLHERVRGHHAARDREREQERRDRDGSPDPGRSAPVEPEVGVREAVGGRAARTARAASPPPEERGEADGGGERDEDGWPRPCDTETVEHDRRRAVQRDRHGRAAPEREDPAHACRAQHDRARRDDGDSHGQEPREELPPAHAGAPVPITRRGTPCHRAASVTRRPSTSRRTPWTSAGASCV